MANFLLRRLKGNIEEAIQGKITKQGKKMDIEKPVAIHVQFDKDEEEIEEEVATDVMARSAQAIEKEEKKIEIHVNVMSNVELEETLEQEVVEILKEKIVQNSDDVLIEVTVSEDLPKDLGIYEEEMDMDMDMDMEEVVPEDIPAAADLIELVVDEARKEAVIEKAKEVAMIQEKEIFEARLNQNKIVVPEIKEIPVKMVIVNKEE